MAVRFEIDVRGEPALTINWSANGSMKVTSKVDRFNVLRDSFLEYLTINPMMIIPSDPGMSSDLKRWDVALATVYTWAHMQNSASAEKMVGVDVIGDQPEIDYDEEDEPGNVLY